MPTVQVRFAPPLHERFVAECEKRDISPSEFIRRAVEAMMDQIDSPKVSLNRGADLVNGLGERMTIPIRKASGIRGFALDGSEMVTGAKDRLKTEKKAK